MLRWFKRMLRWFKRMLRWLERMLRWFPSFQVATTCFSCSPPDLNFLVPFFSYLCTCKITTATGWQTNCSLLLLLLLLLLYSPGVSPLQSTLSFTMTFLTVGKGGVTAYVLNTGNSNLYWMKYFCPVLILFHSSTKLFTGWREPLLICNKYICLF